MSRRVQRWFLTVNRVRRLGTRENLMRVTLRSPNIPFGPVDVPPAAQRLPSEGERRDGGYRIVGVVHLILSQTLI